MKKIYALLFYCCFILGYAQSIELYNPANNVAYANQQYFCAGEKFNLKVNAGASSTGNYAMQPLSDFLISNGSKFIPFSDKVGNNHFSKPLPIGFTFSFFGQDYSEVVVGSNGRLVFTNSAEINNFHETTRFIDQTHSGNAVATDYAKLPSPEYNKIDATNPAASINLAQIFFGYTETGFYNQNDYNKLTYAEVTYQGKKGLLISFDNVIELYSNYSSTITSQVLLLENNHYIINIVKKTKALQNAIVGAQNETGSVAIWIPNNDPTSPYNNGLWNKSSGNLAYEFVPSENLIPVFKWTKNGVDLGINSATLNDFEPTNDGAILKLEVIYVNDTGVQVGAMVSDQIIFKSVPTPKISVPDYASGCGNPAEIHVLNPDANLTYDWYSDTDPTFHKTGTSIKVGNGSYYVQVQNTNSDCTLKSSSELVNISSILPPFVFEDLVIKSCDNLGLGSQNFDLLTTTNYPSNPDYTIQFFEVGSTTPITSANVTSGQVKNFTINVSTNSGVAPVCDFTKNFSISYLSFPPNDQIYTTDKLCFETSNYTIQEFKNKFFPSAPYQILFSGDGINFTSNPVNPQINNSIWVKLSHPDFSCKSIVRLQFDFHAKVIANTPTTQLPPQCGSDVQTFDLASLISEINPDPNVTVTFHKSIGDAKSGTSPVSYSFRSGMDYTTLFIRVVDRITGCVSPDHPDFTLLVYKKPRLLVTSISKINCEGNPIFNLTQNATALTNAESPITVDLEYYSSNHTKLTEAQIINYDASIFGQTPYIKVVYNPTCSGIIPFNLTYNPKPVSNNRPILICSETNYSLENFKNKVIADPSNYTFTELNGNPLPANFSWGSLPFAVKFLIKNNATGCLSDPQVINFVKGESSILKTTATDYVLCDQDFDGKTTFNLDSKKISFTDNASAVFEYFKDAKRTQLINSNYTNETALTQTIYVRITIPQFCPSDAAMNLIVNMPTKSTTLQDKYFICYDETVLIDAGSEYTSWKWSTGETTQMVNFKNPGNYSVELFNKNGCSYTHKFIISDENQPKIQVINQTNNSIEVIAEGGSKPYTYYFNGVPQGDKTLSNPTQSSYVIQVKSATGCFGEPKPVYFIKINNAFSPNGDGINDVWRVENLEKMEQVSIVIVDRSGKKVFESDSPAKTDWDGKANGRTLPTSTYWYVISWFDSVTQKTEQRQGWILLKNRN